MATTPRLSSRDAKEEEAIKQDARLRTVNPDEKLVEAAQEPELKVEIEGEETPKVEEAPKVEVQPEPVHPKVEPAESKADEGVETLKKQIEELKAHRQSENQRLQQALLDAQTAARQAEQYRRQAYDSQYDSVVNTLSAAQTESETAKQQFAIAAQAQDYPAMADAQGRIAKAEAQIARLEEGKRAYEDERNKPQPQQQRNELLPQERAWLDMHPEVQSNGVLRERLDAAYYGALNRGLQRGTQAYFDHIEQELGYRERPAQGTNREPVQGTNSESLDPALVSAPVSRESQTMSGEPQRRTTFRLTREQAEIAKSAGITPQEYAKQLIKLEEMREKDPLKYYQG